MSFSLQKLLDKRNIKSINDLDAEEKSTFEAWDKILSKEEMSVGDIKMFCKTQIEIIENKWADLNTSAEKKSEFIPYHTVYRALLNAIDSPRLARETLENQLNALLK